MPIIKSNKKMTPQAKAAELFQKFYNDYGHYGTPMEAVESSKKCAIILCNEFIDEHTYEGRLESAAYWQSVRDEIAGL